MFDNDAYSWCCVMTNIKTSYCSLEHVPLLWILSPIDVTLYFNGLGIFDCISRACWSKSMCGHRTVDILHRWITELTLYEHHYHKHTNKQRREISHLEYVFTSRQVRGNHLLTHGELYQRTLKPDLLKQRPSSLVSKNIYQGHPTRI